MSAAGDSFPWGIIGGPEQQRIVIVDPDPAWPARYREHERVLRAALGASALRIEHIGSTSVPGLGAKPIIDVLVTVTDIDADAAYLPAVLDAGYVLRVREDGHRMVRPPERNANIHILAEDDPAADAYLVLRDRLRGDAEDRALYERTKRMLAEQEWPTVNDYAEAKGEVIGQILARARAAGDPR
ncbi:GrpB family protein [Brachybacterium nesterenkovii]|uniref:GrpB family protein n=1 Tax=Brachybacterium nesterenkovii TaxID=47847 RepID=UPI00321926F1